MESVKRHDKLLASPYNIQPYNIYIHKEVKERNIRKRRNKTERDFRSEEILFFCIYFVQ